ncbi:MAG: OmpA family protein [Acidobacteriota bacterium]
MSAALELAGDVLRAKGEAAHRWVVDTRRMASLMAGVVKYDDSALVDSDIAQAQSIRDQLEQVRLHFDTGSAVVRSEDAVTIRRVAALVTKLAGLAFVAGLRLSVEVIGHADATGSESSNVYLSAERAHMVTALVAAAETSAGAVTTAKRNSQPLFSNAGPAAENRIVRFTVRLRPEGMEPFSSRKTRT